MRVLRERRRAVDRAADDQHRPAAAIRGPLTEAIERLLVHAVDRVHERAGGRPPPAATRDGQRHGSTLAARPRIAAIGPATAARLRTFGLACDLMPAAVERPRARRGACGARRQPRRASHVLWPRSDIARRELPDALAAAGRHRDATRRPTARWRCGRRRWRRFTATLEAGRHRRGGVLFAVGCRRARRRTRPGYAAAARRPHRGGEHRAVHVGGARRARRACRPSRRRRARAPGLATAILRHLPQRKGAA